MPVNLDNVNFLADEIQDFDTDESFYIPITWRDKIIFQVWHFLTNDIEGCRNEITSLNIKSIKGYLSDISYKHRLTHLLVEVDYVSNCEFIRKRNIFIRIDIDEIDPSKIQILTCYIDAGGFTIRLLPEWITLIQKEVLHQLYNDIKESYHDCDYIHIIYIEGDNISENRLMHANETFDLRLQLACGWRTQNLLELAYKEKMLNLKVKMTNNESIKAVSEKISFETNKVNDFENDNTIDIPKYWFKRIHNALLEYLKELIFDAFFIYSNEYSYIKIVSIKGDLKNICNRFIELKLEINTDCPHYNAEKEIKFEIDTSLIDPQKVSFETYGIFSFKLLDCPMDMTRLSCDLIKEKVIQRLQDDVIDYYTCSYIKIKSIRGMLSDFYKNSNNPIGLMVEIKYDCPFEGTAKTSETYIMMQKL